MSLVVGWCKDDYLLDVLSRQHNEDVDAYFAPTPIVDPSLDKILYISPKTKRKFKVFV